MKIFFIFLILFLSLFLETTMLSLPLVALSILFLGVVYKESWIFPAAFFMGILLDVLSFHSLGTSSIFFILMLGVIFLYDRKFEIQSLPFITIFSFFVSILYGILFAGQYLFLSAASSALLAGGVYSVISHIPTRTSSKSFI